MTHTPNQSLDAPLGSNVPSGSSVPMDSSGPDANVPSDLSSQSADREMKPALWQGWKRQCPECGTGKLFTGYLTVKDKCLVCGEEFHHHRADDAPPYLTILIVGHILAPLMIWFYESFRLEPLVMIAIFGTAATGLTLYLLPRFKGMVITFQWAKRMGGFGHKRG